MNYLLFIFTVFIFSFRIMADSDTVTYEYIKNLGLNPNKVVVDVREPRELQETGTIPHSINVPLGTLEQAFKNLSEEEFKKKFGKTKPEKDWEIIVSCKMGGRSAKAQALLKRLGYNNVKNYSGGWLDWETHLNK